MDKTSIFETAGKFTSKGQFDKAAREYQRVLDKDPDDVRALQKLAELHQRCSRPVEAADLLLRVARIYSNQGFFLKAVAVYKQVLKVGDRVDVRLDLARLYQQLGLVGDAVQQYQTVIAHHEQAGNATEVLSLLKRLLDLDPENVAVQVKLGELYAREGQNGPAVEELRRAAETLEKAGREGDCLRVLERVVQLAPGNVALSRELAAKLLAQGQPKRALARLQVCFKSDPRNVETLKMLARAFSELGQDAKTVSVYRELVHLYDESGEVDARRDTLRRILALVPGDTEATTALHAIEASGPVATAKVAPRKPPPRPIRTAPVEELPPEVARIVTEAEVFLKYGLVAKATEHLRSALAVSPRCVAVHERIVSLLERQGKDGEAARARAAMEAIRPPPVEEDVVEVVETVEDADAEEEIILDVEAPLASASEDDALPFAGSLDGAGPAPADIPDDPRDEAPGEMALVIDEGEIAADEEVVVAVDDEEVLEEVIGFEDGFALLDFPETVAADVDPPAELSPGPAQAFGEDPLMMALDAPVAPVPAAPVSSPAETNIDDLLADLLPPPPTPVSPVPVAEEALFDPFDLVAEVEAEEATGAFALDDDSGEEENTAVLDLGEERTPMPRPAPLKARLGTDVSEEDSQTHYDLGIAYKEMGLFEDAIEAFRRVMARDERRTLDCLLMIGQCWMESGDFRQAMEHLERALQTRGLTVESSKEAHYHLARCLEEVGRPNDALRHYARIHRADPVFRDVQSRARALAGQKATPQADGGTPAPGRPGRSKIGYL